MTKIKRAHFIGVGGAGMSAIALEAHEQGISVSGSDLKTSRYMRSLINAGVEVVVGHDADNVADETIDVVVVSTAISNNNPEYAAAKELGLEIWPRARMLAYLSSGKDTLAVAGTHGKTTTSSMLARALDLLGANPTFLIGGVVDGYDSTSHHGDGSYFVVEADESDGTFIWLDPKLAIVTNVEIDHIDHYENFDAILASFKSFMDKIDPNGAVIVWTGSPELLELALASGRNTYSYGLDDQADLKCIPSGVRSFEVVYKDGQSLALELGAGPGVHNMLNATGVMLALDILGFDREQAAKAVSGFGGVRRRFDCIGEAGGITVIDDYGHHPTEINATLLAASGLGNNKIHVLFQPHRYTRTQVLLNDFANAFAHADTVSLMEIYPAGEAPIPGVNSQTLRDEIAQIESDKEVHFIRHRHEVVEHMVGLAEPGDMIITMGAGDITVFAPMILERLQENGLEA